MTAEHIRPGSDESAMTFSLPLPIEETLTKTQFKRPCVLIVEDYPPMREMCRMILEHSGFEVAEAADGVEALLCVRDTVPDVILMDLWMPLMDGWEATRHLKSDSRTAGIPILALTAHAGGNTAEEVTRAGCSGLVIKPYLPSDLVKEIRQFLNRA